MKRVELDLEAAAEVREAIKFLEERRIGQGEAFEEAVQTALKIIGRQPKSFTPYRGRYRKFVLSEYGYRIFYVEFEDYIWVAAVAHGKREPDYWLDRQPKP